MRIVPLLVLLTGCSTFFQGRRPTPVQEADTDTDTDTDSDADIDTDTDADVDTDSPHTGFGGDSGAVGDSGA